MSTAAPARALSLSALCAAALLCASAPARADVFGPISLASAGTLPGGELAQQAESAGNPVISGNGLYVTFDGTFAGHHGVFRRDVQTGEVLTVAEGDAAMPSISDDGRYISFTTTARLDEQNDTNRGPDVYVRDMAVENTRSCPPGWEESGLERADCAFTLASAVDGHAQGLSYAYTGSNPEREETHNGAIAAARSAIAADGRMVAFETTAVSNLANPNRGAEGVIEAPATPAAQIAVRDLDTKTTRLASVRYDQTSGAPKLNSAGLDEPVPSSPEGGLGAVYPSGEEEVPAFPAPDGGASISADGSTVAWLGVQIAQQAGVMSAEDIATQPKYTEPLWRRVGEGPQVPTRRVSGGSDPTSAACVASGETHVSAPATLADPCQGPFDPISQIGGEPGLWTAGVVTAEGPLDYLPRLSGDGETVAFLSNARDIAFGEELGAAESSDDAYVVDMREPTKVLSLRRLTELASGSKINEAATAPILDLAVSADGTQIAFSTKRTEFPLGSPAYVSTTVSKAGAVELYEIDLSDETLTRVTQSYEGGASENTPGLVSFTGSPSFSDDGYLLAFSSDSDNLTYGDGNGASDAFVVARRRFTSTPTPQEISAAPPNPQPLPEWRLGVTAVSRRDGSVVLEVAAPGAGTLAAAASGAVRITTSVRRARSRHHAARRGRSHVTTVKVASAHGASHEAGLIALPLSLSRRYSSLASARGGLAATVTLTFASPGQPTLHERIDVEFARAVARHSNAHSSRHPRRSRGGRR